MRCSGKTGSSVSALQDGQLHGVDTDVGVLSVGHTGVGVVPGYEGDNDAEDAAGDGAAVGVAQLANAEQQEGDGEEEEQGEEGQGGLHGAERQHEGEDGPANQVEANAVVQLDRVLVGGGNVEPGDGDGAEGHPEAAEGAQGKGTKRVFERHLPHPGQQLHKAAVEDGQAHDDGVVLDAHGARVDERKHKRRQGKRTEPERRRVGKLVCRRSGQPRVKRTTKRLDQIVPRKLLVAQVHVVAVRRRHHLGDQVLRVRVRVRVVRVQAHWRRRVCVGCVFQVLVLGHLFLYIVEVRHACVCWCAGVPPCVIKLCLALPVEV